MNKLILAPTTLPETPPVEYIEAAGAAGYDGVGLRLHRSPGLPFHPVVGNASLIRDIKHVLAGTGLPVFDIFSCYLEPDTRIDHFTPSLALGAELGGRFVMVMGNDSDFVRMRDNFGLFCDEALRFGLTATVEFVPTRPLSTLQIAARMIAEAGRANAAICIDPLHFTRTGGRPADLAALDPKLFPYTQINDGVLFPGEPNPAQFGKMPQGERRMLGEGDVDMRGILDALPNDLPLSVEIPISLGPTLRDIRTRPYTPGEWAKVALGNTRDFLAGYERTKHERARA
jgi:sugar phosphate isomerase/epimerase